MAYSLSCFITNLGRQLMVIQQETSSWNTIAALPGLKERNKPIPVLNQGSSCSILEAFDLASIPQQSAGQCRLFTEIVCGPCDLMFHQFSHFPRLTAQCVGCLPERRSIINTQKALLTGAQAGSDL
jgi:hypothetical protein